MYKPDIKAMFHSLNTEHFGGEIPNIPVVWNNRMTTTAGYCRYSSVRGKTFAPGPLGNLPGLPQGLRTLEPTRIDLSEKLFRNEGYDLAKIERTLIHEMVHAFLVHKYNEKGHTAGFQNMMTRITGEYKNHRCHNYNTEGLRRKQDKKIHCKCSRCGYVYYKARMPKHAGYSTYTHRKCGGNIEFTDTRASEAPSRVKIF